MLDKHSGRAPVRIRKHYSFFDHHGLARVSLRHDVAKAEEALAQVFEACFIEQQAATESARSNFTRDVVLGGSQLSRCYHKLRSPGCVSNSIFESGVVCPNDRF